MCSKKLAQAGIIRIVYDKEYPMPITKAFFSKLPHIKVEHLEL